MPSIFLFQVIHYFARFRELSFDPRRGGKSTTCFVAFLIGGYHESGFKSQCVALRREASNAGSQREDKKKSVNLTCPKFESPALVNDA